MAVPDTLAIAQDLETAGMERRQARAVTQAVVAAGEAGRDDLATKADVQAVKADVQAVKADVQAVKADVQAVKANVQAVKADLQAVKADLQADMAALEARLTWRLVIAAGVIVAAVKLIPAP